MLKNGGKYSTPKRPEARRGREKVIIVINKALGMDEDKEKEITEKRIGRKTSRRRLRKASKKGNTGI